MQIKWKIDLHLKLNYGIILNFWHINRKLLGNTKDKITKDENGKKVTK